MTVPVRTATSFPLWHSIDTLPKAQGKYLCIHPTGLEVMMFHSGQFGTIKPSKTGKAMTIEFVTTVKFWTELAPLIESLAKDFPHAFR